MQLLRNCFSGKKTNPETTNKTMSFLQPPATTQPTIKPRVQVALAPKHGLMDWIRTMNSTPNISGTNGKILNVTEEELAKHNKRNDCWTAISGNVYNITAYLDYHPGGVDEIMKGAGIDATSLFQEIHSWVNFASMLEKCLVGRLISKTPTKNATNQAKKPLPIRLRFDFRQPTTKTLRIFIYTTCVKLTPEQIFLCLENEKTFTAYVSIDDFIHTIALEFLEPVNNHFQVDIPQNNRSQFEIELTKKTEQMWKSIGTFRPNHLSICSIKDFQPLYFSVTLTDRTSVTHDTDWYTFALPSNVFMSTPIGHHIRLKRSKETLPIVKPYTVVQRLLQDDSPSLNDRIQLLIKHYPDGSMTPMLKQLQIGDTIDMSASEGTFDVHRIDLCQNLILLAGGTGLTPMIRILKYAFHQEHFNVDRHVLLLFFNKTEKDILCRNELETLSEKHPFIIHHILSRPDSQWCGETGHIQLDLLQRLVPPPPPSTSDDSSQTLICVCGPTPFTNLTVDLLNQYGYKSNHYHVFLA